MNLQDTLRAYHREQTEVTAVAIDEALGLPPQRWVSSPEEANVWQRRHPGESIVNVATPYEICRQFFHVVDVGADDLVVDLGCGDGRFLLYGALVTSARFRGVEIIAERAATARAAAARLGLEQIEVLHGNVLEFPLDEGDFFYLFRPFSVETESAIIAALHVEAKRRPITIGAHRLQPSLFDTDVFECVSHGALVVQTSR
jgi:SAM-dependent methyltransferase